MSDKDYSSTPLWRKLGIKEGSRVLIDGAPAGFRASLEPLPARVRLTTRSSKPFDVIVVFQPKAAGLERRLRELMPVLDPAGGLWIAYPKKSSMIETDLTFDAVQGAGLGAGLVDNKRCAIDVDWSAVRFVYRLKNRPR